MLIITVPECQIRQQFIHQLGCCYPHWTTEAPLLTDGPFSPWSPRWAAAEGRGVAVGARRDLPPPHPHPGTASAEALPWHLVPGPTLALLAGNGPAKEKTAGRGGGDAED